MLKILSSDCSVLPNISSGLMTVTEGISGYWTFGSVVAHTCAIGHYLTSNLTIMCLSNGSWNGSQPACQVVNCSSPSAPNNGWYTPEKNVYYYLNIVNYSCQIGYDLDGANTSECNATGQWSEDTPECVIKECGNLTDPENGVVYPNCTYYGCSAIYVCNQGYRPNPVDARICLASGNWSESPTCDVICTYSRFYG